MKNELGLSNRAYAEIMHKLRFNTADEVISAFRVLSMLKLFAGLPLTASLEELVYTVERMRKRLEE